MEMTKIRIDYIQRLVKLAKEVRELQLKDSAKLPKDIKATKEQILVTSKINYLLGYIMALEYLDNTQ